jgi:hypothetical protein
MSNNSTIKAFAIESSKYSITNSISNNQFNIINNDSEGYIDVPEKINIELNDSILNTLQYNENISISGNTEFNLPLIYGNVQNTINTRN